MREISLSIEEVASKALGFILPAFFITGIPFFVLHGVEPFQQWSWSGVLVFIVCLFAGIPLHELLHGLVFGLFARGGFKSVRFGIDKKTYSPFCHCTTPIRVHYYRLGALLPLLALGLVPYVMALFNGLFAFWLFGYLYIVAAGGDLLALKMLKTVPGHKKVLDHPEKMGFYVLD